MTGKVANHLWRSTLFAAVAGLIAGPFALGLAQQVPVPSGPPVDPNLRFEVTSIRPYDANSGVVLMNTLFPRLEARGVPVRQLLRQAFRIAILPGVQQDDLLIGVPDWADTERYAVVAKAPDGAPPNGMPMMIANLLKDRFKLATHPERREMPIFSLVLARRDGRLGPALKPSSAECRAVMRAGGPPLMPGPDGRPALPGTPGGPPLFDPDKPQCGSRRTGPGIIGGGGLPLAQLALTLTQITGRPVHDETGLSGIYDFTLRFASTPGLNAAPFGPPPAQVPPPDPGLPNIFTAVQEQLGLRLESRRGPVDVIVVDRIEKPMFD